MLILTNFKIVLFKPFSEQFKQALEVMNRSVGSGQIPGAMESLSYLKNVERDTGNIPSHSASQRFQVLKLCFLLKIFLNIGFTFTLF